jgi:epoxyqueuosine reductase
MGEALGAFLGARVEQAPTLPYKLLAAVSSLGRYGRNNLIYVEGLGTAHILAAYWTEAPCKERCESAARPDMLPQCERCRACVKACPTGAIPETFGPIHVDRCVPLWNETDRSLPEHFPPEAYHALVGCLACQRPCPANGSYFASAELLPELSEGETRLLLEDWQPALKEVLSRLLSHHDEETLREWAPVLRRNLSAYLQAEARSHPVHHP